MSLLTIPLVLAATYLAAYAIATVIVEGADRLGLCYSSAREERRDHESSITVILDSGADLAVAMHREAMRPRTVSRTPIADRIEALEREYATVN